MEYHIKANLKRYPCLRKHTWTYTPRILLIHLTEMAEPLHHQPSPGGGDAWASTAGRCGTITSLAAIKVGAIVVCETWRGLWVGWIIAGHLTKCVFWSSLCSMCKNTHSGWSGEESGAAWCNAVTHTTPGLHVTMSVGIPSISTPDCFLTSLLASYLPPITHMRTIITPPGFIWWPPLC